MKIVIINLDKAVTRLEFQQRQMNKLGLSFYRLSADCDSHQKNFETYRYCWERPMSFSEVALFFNHMKIWKMAVSENQPILILEDDAYLADDIKGLLNSVTDLTNIDYLNIEARSPNKKRLMSIKPFFRKGDVDIFRLYQGRSGAAGYIIWPSGAVKLLNCFDEGKIGIVDKFINAQYSLRAYQAVPAPLIQLDMCEKYGLDSPLETVSSIDASQRANIGIKSYWSYKFKRLKGEVKIALNRLKHIVNASKRTVDISNKFN